MKLLIAGLVSTHDGIKSLLEKTNKLNASAHGPFDAIFAVFDVKDDWLKTFKTDSSFPIPLYFTLHDAIENCIDDILRSDGGFIGSSNMFFLGAGGGIQNVHGLSVAFVSGQFSEQGMLTPTHHYLHLINHLTFLLKQLPCALIPRVMWMSCCQDRVLVVSTV